MCVWCVRASVGRVPARCRLVAAATRCRRLRPDPGAPFHARQELLFLQRSREESQETRPPRDPRYSSQQCARERERERERGLKNTKRKRNEEYSTRSNDRGEPPERVRQLPGATAAKGTVTRGTGSHGQNESCRPHPPSCSGAGACCGVCGLVCPQGPNIKRESARSLGPAWTVLRSARSFICAIPSCPSGPGTLVGAVSGADAHDVP